MEKRGDAIVKLLRKHKKLSRVELMTLTGMSDRVVRKRIEELRNEGFMIGVTASGGYSINNKTDFRRAMAIYKARASKEQKTYRRMQRTLENVNQVRYEG